jgi:hypothetical protein
MIQIEDIIDRLKETGGPRPEARSRAAHRGCQQPTANSQNPATSSQMQEASNLP